MKLLLTVVNILLAGSGIAQLPLNSEGKVEYTEIISVDSANADKLYSNSKLFITYAFKSGKDVTQLTDDVTKTVIGKGTMQVTVVKMLGSTWPGWVYFTINISSKDNRYKYSISDFVLHYQGNSTMRKIEASLADIEHPKTVTQTQWENVKAEVDKTVRLLIEDLKKQMSSKDSW